MLELSGHFERELASLTAIAALVDAFVQRSGAGAEAAFPLQFAAEELFTNMVKYNPGGRSAIRVVLRLEAGDVQMDLTDFDTDPFDVTAAPEVDTTLPAQARSVGGLGLHLTRKLMDQLEYRYDGRTAIIRLRKHLRT